MSDTGEAEWIILKENESGHFLQLPTTLLTSPLFLFCLYLGDYRIV